ncbi:DUF6801 domain-containing protein [Nocardioides daphniae]|uniref:DUF6801 domain-containing protein n=1 Tax=Nocardioides daphniae TaxID=402297 RepID=A0A4P7U9Q9_9ACTN|nr:DUF6801 domain-containing protein [Nocardioides daphniae]QCC76331.1 hypothetical protein E2C04_02310 [Nocardioides daphniae]GGD07834.1 hypothetical protein GCM10007231_03230 [Nocardioides daphniae]
MPEIKPTRRAVIRTAAWSVPAVTVAAAAPAFAASSPAQVTYQTVTKSFQFNPVILGTVNTDPVNIVTVDVTATIPATIPVGETAAPVQTQSTVTIPAGLAGILGSLILGNPATVEGTSVSRTTLAGSFTGESITNLTIPQTPFAAPLSLTASGSGAEGLTIPAGNPTGAVTLTLQPPASQLQGRNASGAPTNATPYASELRAIAGADYTLGTFEIV